MQPTVSAEHNVPGRQRSNQNCHEAFTQITSSPEVQFTCSRTNNSTSRKVKFFFQSHCRYSSAAAPLYTQKSGTCCLSLRTSHQLTGAAAQKVKTGQLRTSDLILRFVSRVLPCW